jgi:hypothetical protein
MSSHYDDICITESGLGHHYISYPGPGGRHEYNLSPGEYQIVRLLLQLQE